MSRLIQFNNIQLRDLAYIEDPLSAGWDLTGGIEPITNLEQVLRGGETSGLVSRFSTYEPDDSRLRTIKHDLEWGDLVLIKDRPMNPLIKHDPSKEGRDQWVIVATNPMKQSLASRFIDRAYSNQPVGLQQCPIPVETIVQAVTNNKEPEPVHFVELNLHYDDHDLTPVRGAPYRLTFGNGSTIEGTLNDNGFARHEGVPAGSVSVEYLTDDSVQAEADELITAFKQELDNIIAQVQLESDQIQAELEDADVLEKAYAFADAAIKGSWETITGVAGLFLALSKGLTGMQKGYLDIMMDLIDGDIDSIEKKLKDTAIAAKSTYTKGGETAEALNLIYREPELWQALIEFPGDYWDAMDNIQVAEQLAPLLLDLIITIFSGGIGAAYVVANKGSKVANLIDKAMGILSKLVVVMRKRFHPVKASGAVDTRIVKTVPKGKKPKVNKQKSVSKNQENSPIRQDQKSKDDIIDGKDDKPYSNPKNRPAYAEGQVNDVWNSSKQKNGKVFDPNTGEELKWDKDKSRAGQWDMGHVKGKEYKNSHQDYIDGRISKEDFLEEYRDPGNYKPESPSANRSRRFEE